MEQNACAAKAPHAFIVQYKEGNVGVSNGARGASLQAQTACDQISVLPIRWRNVRDETNRAR
jgi:hypothetical protein